MKKYLLSLNYNKSMVKSKLSRRRFLTKKKGGTKKINNKYNKRYYELSNYNFKDLDITKYKEPNGWEKSVKLPEEFQKIVYDAYKKIGKVFDKSRFYGIEGFEVNIKPSGEPDSPMHMISFSSPQKPKSYKRYDEYSVINTGVFNIIHFAEVPTEIIPNNLSIIFMAKKKTGNRFFNRYKFEEISRLDIKSGTTLIIPEYTYYKFSTVNSKNGILKMKILAFQCYR